MTKAPELTSPMDSATTVLEKRGLEIFTSEKDEMVVGFELPNKYGQPLPATITFDQELALVEVQVLVIEKMVLPYSMEHELLRLFNLVKDEAPGVVFALNDDEEEGEHFINVTVTHLVVADIDSEPFIARMLEYMEATLLASLPSLYAFLTQRLIHRVGADGEWKGCRVSQTAEQCFEIAKFGKFGTA